MAIETDINYVAGLRALKDRDFKGAQELFKMAEKEFAENRDLRILSEAVQLLLAVKADLAAIEPREMV